MSKTGIRRFDIYLTDLKDYKLDNHFMLVLSNWKSNIKSEDVNLLMLSSKIKRHPCHIDLEFLGKNAQIQAEKIYTINKTKLLKKYGSIENISLQQEIEKAVQVQLQLDHQYNNHKTKHLEENFIKIWNDTENELKLKEMNNKIISLSSNEKYDECIKVCDKLISLTNINKYLWSSNYHKSLQYLKKGDNDKALDCVYSSLKYVKTVKSIEKNYSFSMWLLASIYSKMGNDLKAIEIFSILNKYYKKISFTNFRIATLFSIAKIKNNKNRMKNLIDITEKLNEINANRSDMNKSNLLKEMYEDYKSN